MKWTGATSSISYRKGKRYPEVKKLAMRLDSELVQIVGNAMRITIRPHEYELIPLNTENRKFHEYAKYRISEVLITDRGRNIIPPYCSF